MSLILSGTDGLSDVDGSASTPAIRGTDANTGIFFPAADTIAFAEGGAEVMRIDSSGNVGIGTSSPSQKLHVVSTTTTEGIRVSGSVDNVALNLSNSGTSGKTWGIFSANTNSGAGGGSLAFWDGTAYRMVLDTNGNVCVGTTTASAKFTLHSDGSVTMPMRINNTAAGGSTSTVIGIQRNGSTTGTINNTDNATTYNTSSDYRLKEDVAPMVGALDTVSALKPVIYKWKSDGSAGQGFIAHELQAVVPDCVSGEKDAVETVNELDDEGKVIGTKEVPKYQGIDTSFLVATLTAAIQELKAIVDAQAIEIAELKAK